MAASLPAAVPAARGADAPDPRLVVLRLVDVGPGYRIGNDGGCGPLGGEGASPALLDVVRAHQPYACSIDFNRVWLTPGRAPATAPVKVQSIALATPTDAGARALLGVAPDLLDYFGPERGRPRPSRRTLGDGTVVVDTRALAAGRAAPGVAVVWRSGRLLNVVHVAAPGATGLEDAAFALAGRQQRRLAELTPIAAGDNDDVEVALDNPLLVLPVLWLGRRFDPRGRLPALELADAQAAPARISGPGFRTSLWYRERPRGTLILGIWRPRDLTAFRRTRLGRLVWGSPCTRRRTLRIAGGRALVYAGYASTPRRPCPSRPPDRYLAYAVRNGVVVSVDWPVCLCERSPQARGPYSSWAGMTAIVRGLRVRPHR